jgi:hypothetical protein
LGVPAILARYLARPVQQRGRAASTDLRSLSALLLRGDVLLTHGNTRMAALVRLLTRSPWSHVAMYVGPLEAGPDPRCVVEADVAAGVRAVPLSEFDGQQVRVLRPVGLQDADRRRLADWVVGRIGNEYDHAYAWALARRLLGLPSASRPAAAPGSGFICSSLLARAFVLIGFQISAQLPRDFERVSGFDVVAADTHLCQPARCAPSAAYARHARPPHSST